MQSFLHSHPLALLSVQAVLVIASSRLLGMLLKKLGQPLVIAEVLAGIALGPSLLGVLSPSTLELFFPPSSMPTLGLVSQLGLIFFMFLIGLELEPSLLRGMGKSALAISNVSIAFPFALDQEVMEPSHLQHALAETGLADAVGGDARYTGESLEAMERRHIARVLSMTGGHRTATARVLGITRTTLYKKMHEYGLGAVGRD